LIGRDRTRNRTTDRQASVPTTGLLFGESMPDGSTLQRGLLGFVGCEVEDTTVNRLSHAPHIRRTLAGSRGRVSQMNRSATSSSPSAMGSDSTLPTAPRKFLERGEPSFGGGQHRGRIRHGNDASNEGASASAPLRLPVPHPSRRQSRRVEQIQRARGRSSDTMGSRAPRPT